jgi:hypothetical protein
MVRFALDKDIVFESTYPDYGFSNRCHAHYTPEEYESIRDEIDVIIGMYQQNKRTSDDLCLRGLECRTRQGAQKTSASRRRAKSAVLNEQQRQKELQDFDSDLLSEIYKGFSLASLSQAQRAAKMDAAEARAIFQTMHAVEFTKHTCHPGDDDTASTASVNSFSTHGTDC